MSTTNILDLNNRVTELEKNKGSGGGDADAVTYDNTASHLEATDVQDAIDELAGEIAGLSADDVSYDGTDSGLSAVTVQSAIDETVNKIDTLEVSVENALAYSTTEHKVGKWIDGSDLYEKTIDFGTLPNNTTKSVSSGLSNVTVREIKGYAKSSTNELMMPYTTSSNLINIYYLHSDNSIIGASVGDLSGYTECYITIRYTKNS